MSYEQEILKDYNLMYAEVIGDPRFRLLGLTTPEVLSLVTAMRLRNIGSVEEFLAHIERLETKGVPGKVGPDRLAPTLQDWKHASEAAQSVIDDQNRVLDALPCPSHGRCVPYALDEIARLKGQTQVCGRVIDFRESLYTCRKSPGHSGRCSA